MFLDSFPPPQQGYRHVRPVREPAMEIGKTRSAWPFIVDGTGFGEAQGFQVSPAAAPYSSQFPVADGSSFVT